jgi:hypothetical protein
MRLCARGPTGTGGALCLPATRIAAASSSFKLARLKRSQGADPHQAETHRHGSRHLKRILCGAERTR